MNAPTLRGPRCQCTACGEYFTSERTFDLHRVGPHGPGRRCLTVPEMLEVGWGKKRGHYWTNDPLRPARFVSKSHSAGYPLGYICFYQIPDSPIQGEYSTHFTPLDRGGPSLLLRTKVPSFRLLARAHRYAVHCPQGPQTDVTWGCETYNLVPWGEELFELAPDFDGAAPGFLRELEGCFEAGTAANGCFDRMQLKALETYPKVLPRFETRYVAAVWALYAALVTIILAVFVLRRAVGGLIVFLVRSVTVVPVRYVFGLLSRIHQKV